jgi:hypothetical protein
MRRPVMTKEEFDRWFLEQKRVNENGCWEWSGYLNGGYGPTTFKGKRLLVHRYSLELHLKRQIEKSLEVRHMCNNPICFNPDHLKEGTHFQNMRDMVESNRQSKGEELSKRLKGIKHPTSNGEGNSNSKITEEQVLEILAHKGIRGSREHLSKLYGVSVRQIERIQNGKSWNYITS